MATPAEIAAFKKAIVGFPIQARVRGNEALHTALGPTRKRDPSMLGRVVGYDEIRLRLDIAWDGNPHAEFLAPRYLEVVT
jgi:hypothetical protein